jgi:hypothetical protein
LSAISGPSLSNNLERLLRVTKNRVGATPDLWIHHDRLSGSPLVQQTDLVSDICESVLDFLASGRLSLPSKLTGLQPPVCILSLI